MPRAAVVACPVTSTKMSISSSLIFCAAVYKRVKGKVEGSGDGLKSGRGIVGRVCEEEVRLARERMKVPAYGKCVGVRGCVHLCGAGDYKHMHKHMHMHMHMHIPARVSKCANGTQESASSRNSAVKASS